MNCLMYNKGLFVNNVVLLLKNFIFIDFIRISRIIVTKGDDSKLSKQNISTTVSGDLIVTHLIGKINTADVYEWFNGFE